MMSNEEEKRCPLCAEEMDWTDQQFMPCKCGYQVCVWCWHHIIDMAEKENTEGRCPACRTVYEKEKIVTSQANCERTMSKISNKKTKPPKAKPKAIEVKKDLTNIRVIQRKMAYVIGLPLSLADEDILLRKEYFGQYGKVTKVSLSRTAGGAIQQFINDTCSVYITYSKEEEALRCIGSVHGFVLEGRYLRASFGTAKYCHAWLKNMPCNNPACLYLHSIGADEDSFGKDEVAAVHTRSRVQQIVGATNNVSKRAGNVLPPPDDFCISSNTFNDRNTIGNGMSDFTYGSGNSSADILPLKEKEGPIAVPHKTTTFVDIVGRPNSSASENEGNIPEDRRILNLCSELSSVNVSGDANTEVQYSVPSLFKVSSSNYIANDIFKSSPDEVSNNQEYKDTHGSNHRTSSVPPFYSSNVSDNSGGPALLHKKTHSMNGFAADHDSVHNRDDEARLPVRGVNSVSSDSCQEMKFQNSAKSDRIYRSSKSFSNEEIVEHLRRIGDDNLTNDEEGSVLDAVESSIISNLMSIDFDSCEDSLAMHNGFSEILDDGDRMGCSSWSSLNSDQSGYSFVKQDGFASQMAASVLPDYGDNKEQYFCKPQYPAIRSQTLAPPGFSMPSRDPPPGFSAGDRTALSRPSSGNRLSNTPSFSSSLFPPPSTRLDDPDFFDPAILRAGTANQMNGFNSTPFDESRLWLLMQPSASTHYDSQYSPFYTPKIPTPQLEIGYKTNGISGLDSTYGLSSRQQNCDPSFFTQTPQQKYQNGLVSNSNGYLHGLDDVQHKADGGMTELHRNQRLGVDYFPGYGDLMFSSGDVYTRVFGL